MSTHDLTWGEYIRVCTGLGQKYDASWVTQGWVACDGVQGAVRMMERGWPEGMKRVTALTAPTLASHVSRNAPVARWAWDVTGANYDVGEMLSGVPECWQTYEATIQRPVITLSVNLLSGAGVSVDAYMRRGAAIIALIQALQASEYAVQAWTVAGMSWRGSDAWTRVKLTDDMGGPLDFDRLLFALAHPANARGVTYSLGYKLNGATYRDGSINWYRGNAEAKPDDPTWVGMLHFDGVQYNEANWEDDNSVSAWVERTYQKAVAIAKGGSQ